MQIVRESIFISAIRAFFNTFLGMLGLGVALMIFVIVSGILFFSPYRTEDELIDMRILPNAKGDTTILPETAPVILQINISGVIGDKHLTANAIESFLRASRKDVLRNNRVKGLLLYIDSPGGAAVDSDLIYHAISSYKKEFNLPVYTFIPGLCASGGYMIACAADKIYASPSSIVGSVGVILGLGFNFWQFMQTHGIDAVTLTEGLYKEKYPTFTKPPEGTSSYNDLIAIIQESYEQFINLVGNARNSKGLTASMLRNTYGAQVYLGPTAEKNGYVDNGNAYYNDALTDLVKEIGLENHPYQVVQFNYKFSPLEELVSNKLSLWMEEAQSLLLGIKPHGKLNSSLLYYYDAQDRLK